MTRVIGTIASAMLTITLASCGGGGDDSTRPGAPEVYEAIEAMTVCADLQAEFDQAAESHDRDSARDRDDLMAIDLAYMEAADDRMKALGCYE